MYGNDSPVLLPALNLNQHTFVLSSCLFSSLWIPSVYLCIQLLCAVAISSVGLPFFLCGSTLCFCACVSLCHFSLWPLFPLLSDSINVSFNPPVIWSSPVPSHSTCLSHFETESLDAAWDRTGMQPDTKYHSHGPFLDLTWMPTSADTYTS